MGEIWAPYGSACRTNRSTSESEPAAIDSREFRKALGQFATGVTIVTARGRSGECVGATVSSFNSVSIDPPLVLWSLDKRAFSRPEFESSTHFAIHVLTLEQRELAQRFATRGLDKFAGLECREGLGGAPLLGECAASFECETQYRYDGGDHLIFVGEVKRFERLCGNPLIFYGGVFAEARQHLGESALDAATDEATGRFGPDFICYLLARAHFQTYLPLARHFAPIGVSETEYFVLSMLCIRDPLRHSELAAMLDHTGRAPDTEDLDVMAGKGYVSIRGESVDVEVSLTEEGRRAYILLLTIDGRIARQALAGFAPREIADLAGYLRRVMANTDTGSPEVWVREGGG
jgi:3-hydroxy-9,10-secoandrosta-1,3,5(10)-triene-9,17-dione monooxygenase reductase component